MPLYIPHGSDNTETYKRGVTEAANNFISHMVQIIRIFHTLLILCCSPLYIPHGSDNTSEGVMLSKDAYKAFISHMVQIIQ